MRKVTIAPDFESLLPPLSEGELATLEESLVEDPKNPELTAVTVWVNGPKPNIILGGHHRYKLCVKHKIEPKFIEKKFDDRSSAMLYAMRSQFGRRNMTTGQKVVALSHLPRYGHGGERATEEQVGKLPLAKLADMFGLSQSTVQAGLDVVDKGSASVIAAMASNDVSVSDAAAVVDLPKPKQDAALKKVKTGKASTLRKAAGRPAKKPAKKSGAAKTPRVVRADLQKNLGVLIRSLEAAGIYSKCDSYCDKIAEKIKEIK